MTRLPKKTARRARRSRRLALERLESRLVLSPIISEFLASNTDPAAGLRDFEGTLQDWIEIYNPDSQTVDLTGWKLKDSGATWIFPALTLGPGEFSVVFASDKNLTAPELHTNFKLKRDPGEYLALLDDANNVVHQYSPEYPNQEENISYGIGQEIQETKLVSAATDARYFVPSEASLDTTWMQTSFDDGSWALGSTGLGFANLTPGFAVWNYKANVTVPNLDVARTVIDTPSYQSAVYTETADMVNYLGTGGGGHFAPDAPFPGMPFGTDYNDFVTRATGVIHVPTTGPWTFGVNSDDGFRLKVVGATFNAAYGTGGTTAVGDTLEFFAPRGPADSFGVINNLAAGDYEVELISYERGGGACTELFAAAGVNTAWNGSFHLVGDTANGGLSVQSEPFDGQGSSSTFAGLVQTNVKTAMQAAGSASLYSRIPFDVENPQSLESLTLKMKYDDGYVAYLNGVEIARRNAPTTLAYDSWATGERADSQAIVFENVGVSEHLGLLQATGNVLSIQSLNYSPTDGDMLVLPELSQITYLGLEEHFFSTPTPGDANAEEFWYRVGDTHFSEDRGFYDAPFQLTISTATPGATIRYSLDGATPLEADNTKSVVGVTRDGSTASATIVDHGYADGDWVLIRGADQPEYNGVFVVSDVTLHTFTYLVAGTPATPATPATGTITAQANYFDYTEPITVDRSTTVRAAAFKSGYAATDVDTQTYVFLDDILAQSATPPGFPATWDGVAADYEMDPSVVNDPAYSDTLKQALLSLPTMSIVTDEEHLFDPATGIYANPLAQGWERPASLEYFDPNNSDEFQINAGLRIYGGYGRNTQFKKHSFRVLFKGEYGDTKLRFPLFGDQAVDEFDTIILRSNFNDGWTWGGTQAQFIRDQFADRSLLAMMSTASHGEFVHLYVNGLYWGVYNPVERPDASFAASYFGGDKEDWDGVNSGSPTGDSDIQPWRDLINFDFEDGGTAAYQRVQGNFPDGTNDPATESLLDVNNYIDYMMINFFVANADWPGHNWYGGRLRGADSTGFKFFTWDTEMALGLAWIRDPGGNVTGVGGPDSNNPAEPYYWLSLNDDFRMLFADHAHNHLFNAGALTTDVVVARYQTLAEEIEATVSAESARWGDVMTTLPYTPTDWQDERDWILNTYLPQRNGALIQQLRDRGLYPGAEAPSFQIDGVGQHGGTFSLGAALSMTAPAGTIYYTLDGTDPREPGGAIRPGALIYSGPVTLNGNAHVKSRAYIDGEWTALNEATYYVDLAPSIRITEIMYNPADPNAAEIAAGYTDNDDFEFLEIQNIGAQTLPLGGLRFANGIALTFPETVSIAPGEYKVVVRDQSAFLSRYSTVDPNIIAGVYTGKLDNAGEKVELASPVGGAIHLFEYKDGWYDHSDGEGFSLTIRDPLAPPLGSVDPWQNAWNASEGWRASAAPGGTPGFDDTLTTPGSVIINEVLAHQDATAGDVVEFFNNTDQALNVGGWFLSDDKDDLTKYQIAVDTWIEPLGYLALTEHGSFGVGSGDPGAVVPFAFDEHGDDVYLSSDASGVAGGYREHIDFGATPNGVSVGLHVKSTGGTDFTLLETPTFGPGQSYPGAANGQPYIGPLAINEVMYHPATATAEEIAAGFGTEDFEFIEVYNRSAVAQTLRDFYVGSGLGFTFGWYNADGFANESWTLEPGSTATWTTGVLESATYEVSARYDLYDAEGDRRDLDDAAQYLITHAGGATPVVIDQDDDVSTYLDPQGWVSLGTYTFDGTGTVLLTRGDDGSSDWTIADRVRFTKVGHEVIVDSPTLDSPWTTGGPTTLAAGQYLVLVNDYAAFDSRYGIVANGIPVAGVYSGLLGNGGDAIKLFQMGEPDPMSGYLPNYRTDYVNFRDHAPWPEEPDGVGSSLNRLSFDQYGNDPINWEAGAVRGTPGFPNVAIDKSAPWSPTDLSGHVTVAPDTINLSWTAAIDQESYVDHYIVYRDGVALGDSPTTSYQDGDVLPLTSYSYQISAVNRDGYEGTPSDAAVVTVPGIVNYAAPDSSHIEIAFTEPLNPATATVPANYVFVGGTLAGAGLSTDGLKVSLTTAEPLVIGDSYSVTINNLTTVSGNELDDGLQIAFTYAPQGNSYILREYWTGIGGSLVSNLTDSPDYPDNPTGKTFPTLFEAPVNWADSYGTRMQGYVHPPVSGDYVFWLAANSHGELWLSTEEDPAEKVLIASVSVSTGSREWTKFASQESAPVQLMAGRKYYIEALAKEGSGADNLAVRWSLPGGVWEDPANPGAPIPGVRLSQWGPPPDFSPPTVPANLSAQVIDGDRVDLSWNASSDPETSVHHYVIYRDGQSYATSTAPSYSDLDVAPGRRRRYQVTAANSSYVESGPSATISVAPVGMVSAAALDATTIELVFTEPMDRTLAEEVANYALSGGITVSAASLQADRLAVRLTTSSLPLGGVYTVTVNNLRTADGVALPAALQTSFPYGNGILWEYWLNTSGGAVADLTNSPNFPHNPSGQEFRTLFEARSNWQDNYGGRMSGYLLPTTTGNYRFWIASDDNGELWLSTDDDPANKSRIAYVPGWSPSREWTKFAQQESVLIPLVAGRRYYIEALQKEGGGGDNLAVAWQREGTAFDGAPIPGSFLSPYFESFSPLPFIPAVQALSTSDPTPAIGGAIDDPDVAITVSIGGRYYAATRDASDTWRLPDNAVQPALADGVHDVTVCATDVAGRVAFDVTVDELNVDTVPPTAAITAVSPDPRNTPVSQVEIVFSEPVSGFDQADLTLNRDGGANLLTASQTLSTSDNMTWVLDGLAGVTQIGGGYSLKLTAVESGIADAVGSALTADARVDWTNNSPPTIAGVFFRGGTWREAFLNELDSQGHGHATIPHLGFANPVGDGSQLDVMPWTNVNQISVVFDQETNVEADDLTVLGVNTSTYALDDSAFSYDPVTYTATWSLVASLSPDKLLLVLDSDPATGVRSPNGVALDGEWVNPTDTTSITGDTFPSGDGLAGGDFAFRVDMHPGNVNGDQRVTFSDFFTIRARLGQSPGDTGYHVIHDLNGDARITFSDAFLSRARLGLRLPAGEPMAADPVAQAAAFDMALLSWVDLDSSDEDDSDILTQTLADDLALMLVE